MKQGFGFMDSRPEADVKRKIQEMAIRSSRKGKVAEICAIANNHNKIQVPTIHNQPIQKFTSKSKNIVQLKSIPGVSSYGNFSDLGNGLFGTTQVTNAGEVAGLVNAIRQNTTHQNIKVLTGTHGTREGHLIGEQQFYTEDMAHEGHKIPNGGWINVLDVVGQSKSTIAGWMVPGHSVIILAWCYSKKSVENWENVHHATKAPSRGGKVIW